MTAQRKTAIEAGDAIAEILPLVPQLSDEEWDRRDAEVRANMTAAFEEPVLDRLAKLESVGFPRRAIRSVRRGITPPPAIARLRDAVGDDVGIVVISGPKGVGKTVAATWWAAQRRDRVQFVRAADLLASSRYDREARADLFSSALVLDDLGAEYADPKGSFAADLDELVDVFYGSMRPLLITTNCDRDAFRQRYSERIVDRLRECGRWIAMTGESLRRRD